jgi:hypothetical protein
MPVACGGRASWAEGRHGYQAVRPHCRPRSVGLCRRRPVTRVLEVASWVLAIAASLAVAADKFRPADFHARADFELVVERSKYLRPGASNITALSAFVSLVHGLTPGNADGLEVNFFDSPVNESDLPDPMRNDAREKRKGSYAAMVLYLDKQYRVSQVNLGYVVPGTTVARTVAGRPDELKRYFSRASFKDDRLAVKSSGTHSEADPAQDVFKLSWNVDLDLPVKRDV